MDTLLTILKDFQPAGMVIIAIAVMSMVANHTRPDVGPWAALIAVAGVAMFVGNRVMEVQTRPGWLLPLALSGLVVALAAGYRLFRAIQAHNYNDHTVGYVFPTSLAIASMWLSIALINFQTTHETLTQALAK